MKESVMKIKKLNMLKKDFCDELLTEENELKCEAYGQQRGHALSINFVSHIL